LPDDFQIVLYGVEERALLEDHVVQVLEKGGEFGDGFGNGCDLGDREGDGEMRDARCEMREDRMGSARDVREIDEVEERKMEGWESQQ
jgi:hypothetical protein